MQYDGIGRALYVYGSRELDHKWMLTEELFPWKCSFRFRSKYWLLRNHGSKNSWK